MKTALFIQALSDHQNHEIEFQVNSNYSISGNFHITEVLNARYETIDCGANIHEFKETIVQIINGSEARENQAFSSNKAMNIFDQVIKNTRIDNDAPVFVEYGDEHFPTQKLPVRAMEVNGRKMKFILGSYDTQCKPSLQKLNDQEVVACC